MKINIYNQTADSVGSLELDKKVFELAPKAELIHQAMVAQMSNERLVLAHTKDRSEVRGGGKKPWKQKGTGRARVGSSRSPIWIGGGVTFGPRKDRNFSQKINKKMRQKALCMVLSDRSGQNSLVAIDKIAFAEFKTKKFNEFLTAIEKKVLNTERRSALIITDVKDEKVKYSGRNLANVKMINLENINILDLLKYRNIILTVDALKKIEEQYKK